MDRIIKTPGTHLYRFTHGPRTLLEFPCSVVLIVGVAVAAMGRKVYLLTHPESLSTAEANADTRAEQAPEAGAEARDSTRQRGALLINLLAMARSADFLPPAQGRHPNSGLG